MILPTPIFWALLSILPLTAAPPVGGLESAERSPTQVAHPTSDWGVIFGYQPPEPAAAFPTSFRPHDCQWVADELNRRDVQPWIVDRMAAFADRESQCCPNVQGGDRVNDRCQVTHVAAWHHRSDTGLFQLNGVHWKTERGIACPEYTCSQAVLLADIGMQFDVMLNLLERCGFKPWQAPRYGCAPMAVYQ